MFLVRSLLLRRLGPVGAALTAYDLWRRVPADRRRRLVDQGRRHGSRLAHRLSALASGRG